MTLENWPSKMAVADQPLSHFISAAAVTSAEIVRLRRAVDDEGSPRQRLEQGRDIAVGVEIMRPGGAAAQRQEAVRHRKRLVGAHAEFAARGRDVLAA